MRSQIFGFTLLELIITILVMAILLSIGVPSYLQFREDNILQGAAQALYADIQFARSEAIKRNTDDMVVHLFKTGDDWCYQVSDNPDCSSCGDNDCDIHKDGILRGVTWSSYPKVSMTSSTSSVTIQSQRAIMNTNRIIFSYGQTGKEIEVRTTPLGRVFMCTPIGKAGLAGVDKCPSS